MSSESPLPALEAELQRHPTARYDAPAIARLLRLQDPSLAPRILACLHRDLGSEVSGLRLLLQLRALYRGGIVERLRFVFDMHDTNHDGRISREELALSFQSSLRENRLQLSAERRERLVDTLMKQADTDRDGLLSFHEFRTQVERSDVARIALESGSLAWLGASERPELNEDPWIGWQDRWPRWLVRGSWGLLSFGLGLWSAIHYRLMGADGWIQLARFCGKSLDLQVMLICMPIARVWITWLRRPLGRWLPLDDHIDMHRLIGDTAFALAWVHTMAHIGHLFADQELSKLLTSAPYITGLVWILLYSLLWGFARERIRRSHRFELFQKTHLLYAPWLLLAALHTPKLWPWLAVGLFVFGVDRLVRARRRVFETHAERVEALSSGVTLLEIARPPDFSLHVGDYLFLKVPALSSSEWHPFTISSAPERTDALTVHVRTAGNWTGALYQLAQRRRDVSHHSALPLLIEGPYGAPAGDVFRAEVVILVGAGIGITPFAATIESLLVRSKTEKVPTVHLVWVLREQRAMEWFTALLARAEKELPPGILRLHLYLSSIRSDMDAGLFGMALDAHQQAGLPDPISGLSARTHCGKPDWDSLLSEVSTLRPTSSIELFSVAHRDWEML